jgi:hypothetical protein
MDDPVSAVELRLHVERIVDHAEFRESPRHRQLLRYLANHAIATGGRSVSPQAIEADVLARSAGGRTRALTPATVMVSDLRDKLARYAAEAGRGDEVRITIPRRDCRLEVTRVRPATPPERAALPPGTPRPLLMVVEFDAEPAVCSLAKPLATAISLRLGDSHAVIPAVSRREIAARGLAVEHAPAAWDADAAVHGMLMALPGEQDLDASIGASVRLIAADAAVLWTLWCEESLAVGNDQAIERMAEKIGRFVVDGISVSGRGRNDATTS